MCFHFYLAMTEILSSTTLTSSTRFEQLNVCHAASPPQFGMSLVMLLVVVEEHLQLRLQ